MTHFFRAVKVLPVERGAGLHQLGMRAAENRLNEGDWIHIFPGATFLYHSLPIYASFLYRRDKKSHRGTVASQRRHRETGGQL